MTDSEMLDWIEENPGPFLDYAMHDFWEGLTLRQTIKRWAKRMEVE